MIFTLVGSRKAPEFIQYVASEIGRYLASKGYVRRSGGALGMDSAWLKYGPYDNDEIYRHDNRRGCINVCDYDLHEYMELAESLVPRWDYLDDVSKLLHARNCCQVLGTDLKTPSKALFYYAELSNKCVKGGTASSVRLAQRHNIPTFNLRDKDVLNWWCEQLDIEQPPEQLSTNLSFLEK